MLDNAQLGEMSVEMGVVAARKIRPFAEFVMLYFVGEPLLHPRIFDFIDAVRKEIDGKIAISTNAVLLDENARSRLLASGIDIVICSIDGNTKSRYERIRKGANYETVITNVECLLRERREYAPQIIVKCIDVGISKTEAMEFEKRWSGLGATAHLSWFNTWGGTLRSHSAHAVAPFPYENRRRVACADLWFKMVVNWNGDVVLCCVDWNSTVIIGNIFKMELNEIWHGEAARRLREKHGMEDWGGVPRCSKCTQWSEMAELDIYCSPSSENHRVVF
jgi:radical SAM protein with 4Fe4S-binding SPASM domain